VEKVIAGFERRGMFFAVERHVINSPHRVTDAIDRHRDSPSSYIAYIESDVAVFDTKPCWLTRMRDLMDGDPQLGLLGSYIDTRDFIDPIAARRIESVLDPRIFNGLIKAESPERSLPEIPPDAPLMDPFNPPGRLAMLRKDVIDVIRVGTDGAIYTKAKAAGIGAGIATGVRHRHLSLLNFYDYPDYDVIARDKREVLADS
jgi:hypothetical protein